MLNGDNQATFRPGGREEVELSPCTSRPHSNHPGDDYYFPGAQNNLNEVAAPEPIFDATEKPVRSQKYLDNMRSRNSEDFTPVAEQAVSDHGRPNLERTASRKRHQRTTLRTKIFIISYLILFSTLGTLTRVVIETLTFYPGTPVTTSALWANFAGSLIMGFLSEDHELFRSGAVQTSTTNSETMIVQVRKAHVTTHKKTVPLFIGLTTGYCGCLTSYSSFMLDAFLAISDTLPAPLGPYAELSQFQDGPRSIARTPNGGFRVMALLAVMITEIGLSMVALFVGAHLAILTASWMPTIRSRILRKGLDPLVMILAPLQWVVIICLAILLPRYSTHNTLWSADVWRSQRLYALAFAPVGCLLRFFISMKLNRQIPAFPLGTFVVNISGTMILGIAFSLQHAPLASSGLGGGSYAGCQILQGVMDGFCGCLTTVSTWILELSDTRRRHAYIYGSATVAVAFALLVVEIGSLKWSRGFSAPACF
jgi:CrcB protein